MSTQLSETDIEYPESDGKPMGETDLHRNWMFRIIELLQYRYRQQRVYVTGDLVLYYEEGRPHRFVVPDAFVVKESDPGPRRTYKVWDEGKVPNVVFETTSRGSKHEDTVWKHQLYERLGVPEYFLYDPTGDYLDPPLSGYRLGERGYAPIRPGADGWLDCDQLGIQMGLEEGDLVMRDGRTGERLQTASEAAESALEAVESARASAEAARASAEAAREAAEARVRRLEAESTAERVAREAAEARAREFEAELKRLRGQHKPA